MKKRKQRIAVVLTAEKGREMRGWTNRRKCYEDLQAEGFEMEAKNLWRWYADLSENKRMYLKSPDGRRWRVMVVFLK